MDGNLLKKKINGLPTESTDKIFTDYTVKSVF